MTVSCLLSYCKNKEGNLKLVWATTIYQSKAGRGLLVLARVLGLSCVDVHVDCVERDLKGSIFYGLWIYGASLLGR